jgi:hypothetical protein
MLSPVEAGVSTWVDLAQMTAAACEDRESSQSGVGEKKNPIVRRPNLLPVKSWIQCKYRPRSDPARHVVWREVKASRVTARPRPRRGVLIRVHKTQIFT